ncbi:MAG: hypothetical protein QM765_25855 [Myxococcales bacterium]
MSSLFAVGSLLAAVAFADAVVPLSCEADTDCLVTMSGGCCGTCCPIPVAVSKAQHDAQRRRCATVDCAMPRCQGVECAKSRSPDSFVAVCRGHQCVLEDKPARTASTKPECRADSDCTVAYPDPGPDAPCHSSPCGCCPGSEPVATPLSPTQPTQVPAKEPEPAQPQPPSSKPKPSPPTPTVACSPCQGPKPGHAVCREGRCVLAPK